MNPAPVAAVDIKRRILVGDPFQEPMVADFGLGTKAHPVAPASTGTSSQLT